MKHFSLTSIGAGVALTATLSTHAFAQSSVQLYGIIDTAVTYVNNAGGACGILTRPMRSPAGLS